MNLASFDPAMLHLLRPHWLWALCGLPLLFVLWRVRRRRASVWRENVDAHLLPHLLVEKGDSRSRWAWGAAMLGYVLAVFALAGPSWRQSAQPLWQSRTPLVIALDLSGASLAGDLPPTRLAQARAKIATLLRERQGGQVGLVVFAQDAFTVAPLTEDAGNVALFLDALSPDVMPVDGQRADRAIEWSAGLLRQAGFTQGTILLIADHADDDAREAAAKVRAQGFQVDVLGMGTSAGATYKRGDGAFVQARLDAGSLRAVASAGGGRYADIATDDADLRALGVLDPDARLGSGDAERVAELRGRAWLDEGYWLLPPLMLLSLLAFRRRGALAVVLLFLAMPQARAADWWRRADQVEHAQMDSASQAYRSGDFAKAAQQYQELDSADAHYNRGNALAKAGQYPQAIAAYDQALKRQPGMEDAIANRRAVEVAMKRKPPQGGGSGSQSPPSRSKDHDQRQGDSQASQSPSQSQPQQPKPQDDAKRDSGQQPPSQADAQSQQAADAAQRERMQRALEQQRGAQTQQQRKQERANETPQQREQRLANEAWLRRVPDDPGGLLREKFRIEHERRQSSGEASP
ncbi:VWA domain-containing protein [Lysobacter sp.]|uniref:VWA domain-containing protein n=1 Tax=Lysobacter sp. TaxID=72226 RepID=UPI002D572515|nr:VWA domain-containing protein [Lysobacter sp.]HZX78622.1 VWA domain-containing protein [Lysobacter sp.]